MTRRGLAVTSATTAASRFSSCARAIKCCASSAATTTAIRSCDSDIASSVPPSPSYFFNTASSLMSSPSANSPTATLMPPAPKSLHRFINCVTLFFLNSLCSLRSVGGLPFCTSAPQVSMDSVSCAFEEPVAPPQPSLPVRPPRSKIKSPGAGTSLRTLLLGEAPMTAPISMRLAT